MAQAKQKQVHWHTTDSSVTVKGIPVIRLVCWVNLGVGFLTPGVDWSKGDMGNMWDIGQEFHFRSMEG